MSEPALTSFAATQQGPRPLPLFLSLLRSETATSPERRAAALAGLKAYQEAAREPSRALPPAIAQIERASLRDYGGNGPPVVFIPSLINPPFVLDLADDNSMLRWLATQGLRPLLVDWGTPGPENRAQGLGYHIEHLLLPLLESLDEPPVLAGYCLGGTLALGAACARPVAGLVTIAAPWRFTRYGEEARGKSAALWEAARPVCETLGLVPMEVLQSGFWQLDPVRTIAKYEKFGRLAPDSAAARSFVALEDWANGGAPLTFAAGKDIFELLLANDRPGRGRWWVAGHRATPRALQCPAIEFISATDRIVPAASAAGLAEQRILNTGHVGMVVGGRAQPQLWEPLRDWCLAALHTR